MTERNPRYDNLQVFKPNLQNLMSGDVFLTRNAESTSFKRKAQSGAIANATGGNFSHALLCTTPPSLIEAIGDGVSQITLQRCFAHDLKNIRVLRYFDQQVAKTAGGMALRFLGQGYSVRGAIRSIMPATAELEMPSDQTFCSALVATAFRAAGAPEFATINPSKMTPASLEMSECFADVTPDAFLKILAPRNIEEMSALDGDRLPSPLGGQTKLFNSYYATLAPLINAFLDQYPGFPSQPPLSLIDCIDFIITTLAVCQRLPRSGEVERAIRELKVIDEVAFNLLAEGKWQEMQKAAQARDDASHHNLIAQSFMAKPDISLADLEGIIRATEFQIVSRSSILNDTARPLGASRAWDEWVNIAQEVIASLTNRLTILNEVKRRVFPTVNTPRVTGSDQ